MAKDTLFIDPKKFKHLSSDGKTTILQHKDGHELRIHHDAVSPRMREQLQALAKGGSVENETGVHKSLTADEGRSSMGEYVERKMPHHAKEHAKMHLNELKSMPKPKLEGLAEGGKVQQPREKPKVKTHNDPRFGNTTVIDNEDKRHGAVIMKAEGGYAEKGVTRPGTNNPSQSLRGMEVKRAHETSNPEHKAIHTNNAKHLAKETLHESRSMPKPKLEGLAEGGKVVGQSKTPQAAPMGKKSEAKVQPQWCKCDSEEGDNPSCCLHRKMPLKKMALGGEALSQAALGHVGENSDQYPPCLNQSCKSYGKSHPNCTCWGSQEGAFVSGGGEHMAEGGSVGSSCSSTKEHREDCQYYAYGSPNGVEPGIESGGEDEQPSQNDGIPMTQGQQLPDMPDYNSPESQKAFRDVGTMKGAPPPDSSNTQNPMANQPQPVMPAQPQDDSNIEQESADAQAAGDQGQQPQAMAAPQATPEEIKAQQQMKQALPQASPEQQDAAANHKVNALKEFAADDMATAHDLANGHITPQTYGSLFHSQDALGKIGMLFGLLVSGAGSGLAKQPNAVIDMMNSQIKNDLNAQQNSKTNAQNLYKLNLEKELNKAQIKLQGQQGQLVQGQAAGAALDAAQKAYALSNMQMNRMSLHDLVQNAQKLPPGTPQRQQADNALAMLSGQVNNENYNIADRAASTSALANSTPAAGGQNQQEAAFQQQQKALRVAGQSALAEDNEAKHMPGFPGKASGNLDGGDKSYLRSGTLFQNQMDNFIDWTKQHSGSLNPTDIKTGRAMAADLQGAYRQATHGGVYKEGEQNFISKLIDEDPTKFFNKIRVLPSLNAVSEDNKNRVNQYAKSLGLGEYQGSSPQKAQQSQIQTKGGVQYKKVPGGWVPVK